MQNLTLLSMQRNVYYSLKRITLEVPLLDVINIRNIELWVKYNISTSLTPVQVQYLSVMLSSLRLKAKDTGKN